MVIKLEKLTLRNFKGVRDFTFAPRGSDASVYGPNASGKTTLADAFHWLLTGKDSGNRTQFELKTLGSDSRTARGLELEVSATLTADGKSIELQKQVKEKWKRPRGKSLEEFDGHQTNHWVDGSPVSAEWYDERVSGFVGVESLRLITDPWYFNTVMHWQARRRALVGMCGEATPEEVEAESGGELNGLSELLGSHPAYHVRKALNEQRRTLIEAVKLIGPKIQALSRATPRPSSGKGEAEAGIAACQAEVAEIDAQMASAQEAIKPHVERGQRLHGLELKLREYEDMRERKSAGARLAVLAATEQLAAEVNRRERALAEAQANNDRLQLSIETASTALEGLRAEHERVQSERFYEAPDAWRICEACGQELPEVKKVELSDAARESFEARKASNLSVISLEGKRARTRHDSLTAEAKELVTREATAVSELAAMRLELEALREGTRKAAAAEPEPQTVPDPHHAALCAEIEALRAEIEASPHPHEDTEGTRARRDEIAKRMQAHMKTLSDIDAASRAGADIAEYERSERELSDQLAELDGKVHLLDEYARAVASKLECAVNEKFGTVRFRLFKELVGGQMEPTCEALVGGVPYPDCNTAAQLNAGMEVIGVLNAHYDAYAPVFVDRCESIEKLTSAGSQVIRLVVGAGDASGGMLVEVGGSASTSAEGGVI